MPFEHFLHEINAFSALRAVSAFSAFRAVRAVRAVWAVDVAVLIGDEVEVGGSGSVLVRHGFFSYKKVGVALPK